MNHKRILFLLSFLLMTTFSAFSQSRTYTGTIGASDEPDPLIGAAVVNMATNAGTVTDFNGLFSIDGTPGDSLQISYLSYESIQFVLTDETSLSITLVPSDNVLDEVVVIGYGTIKKSDLTGSVSSVKAEDIVKVPSSNPMQALQGKVAGLQVLSTSGDPGVDPVVRLRGITTLNDNNPIAVIDGVISDLSAVSMLNSNDIESMEVLKDASAIAIYGSRGAAGVIIISTKRGASGQNLVQVSVEQSFESIAHEIDVMSGREFATYINVINPGTYNNLDALPNTDWQSLIYEDFAPMTNANFSVSGGSQQVSYYFGLGYFNQSGVIPKSGLERLTAKLNTNYNLSDHIDIGLDMSMLLNDKDNAPGVVNTSLRAWPVQVPYNPDGSFAEVDGGNALAAIEYSNSNTKSYRALGNLYANVHFLKHFTFKSSVQFDLLESKAKSFVPVYFVAPLQQNDESRIDYNTFNRNLLIFENTLTYSNEIGKHNFNVLAGYSSQKFNDEFLNGGSRNLLREFESFWYIDGATSANPTVSNNRTTSALLSTLGRINYSYDSRYLFTASVRRDGSSKFGENNRYGVFPSVALGWNVSREGFFPETSIISNMKFRTSWGIIGNEKIPPNAQYALIESGRDAVFGPGEVIYAGASFSGGGNPNLKWEETELFNVGLDLDFLESKLIVEMDYYIKHTSDILVPLEPIGYTGTGAFQTVFFNAADVRNSGFEWNILYRNRKNKWNYAIGLNGSTIKNEVTNIGQGFGADSLLIGGDLGNGQQVSRSAVGYPIGFFYGYEVEGVFQNETELANGPALFGQEVGDLKFRDVNGDGVLNSNDRTYIGNSIPDVIFGFNFELGYDRFTLSGDIQGQFGNDIYNGKQAIRYATLNFEDKYNNYWTGEGSTNEYHKPSLGGPNFQPSDYFVEDGSFIRLRSLTLNYQIPDSFLGKIGIIQSNIYLRTTNLFTATSYTGYSPEIGASSAIDGVIDQGVYPVTRVFTIGFNANF